MPITPLDLDSLTIEKLIDLIPEKESEQWEWKHGSLANRLDGRKWQKFQDEIATQLSAFANSGGGWLIIGLNDAREPTGLDSYINPSMPLDVWVLRNATNLVSYAIDGLRAKIIQSASDPLRKALIIEVPDSPAAPHQAIFNKVYYRRNHDESEPAPHFYVDLLRRRTVECSIALSICVESIRLKLFDRNLRVGLDCQVEVVNSSNLIAQPVGFRLAIADDSPGWLFGVQNHERTLEWNSAYLFPKSSSLHPVFIRKDVCDSHTHAEWQEVARSVCALHIEMQSFSHNFASKTDKLRYPFNTATDTRSVRIISSLPDVRAIAS